MDDIAGYYGLFLSDGTKLLGWGPHQATDGYVYLDIHAWNSITAFNSAAAEGLTFWHTPTETPKWWRIRDTGTQRIYGVSWNGVDWIEDLRAPDANNYFFAPDRVGWGQYVGAAVTNTLLRCRSFKIT
jgi:hypothetical protein